MAIWALACAMSISKGCGSIRNSSCPALTSWFSCTNTPTTVPPTSALTETLSCFT